MAGRARYDDGAVFLAGDDVTTMTDEYYHTLCDRFDALWRRREEQGGTLGPGRQEEFDRLGRAIIEACDELGVHDREP